MGLTSIWHWLIVLVIVLVLFGAGKLPKVMGDLAKGIKNFKAGLKEDEVAESESGKVLKAESPAQSQPVSPQPVQPQSAPVPPASAAAHTVDQTAKQG